MTLRLRPTALPARLYCWKHYTVPRVFYSLADRFSLRPLDSPFRHVFVVGCGNSGTTLLATLLGRHPQVLGIGHESTVFKSRRSLRTARMVVHEWDVMAQQQDCSMVVEKTPKHVRYVHRIYRLLPDARIVAIVRDAREAVASLKRRGFAVPIAINRWYTDNRAIADLQARNQAVVVYYEDLVEDPESSLQAVCREIGLPFRAEMLECASTHFVADGPANMKLRVQQVRRPVMPRRERWRDELGSNELTLLNTRCGALMRHFGYE